MRRFSACFFVIFCGAAALAQPQSPTDPSPQTQTGQPSSSSSEPALKSSEEQLEERKPKDERQPPPTPLEEREKEIRKFDPLGGNGDPDAEEKAAQQEKDKEDRETKKRVENDETPLPGSIAADDANTAANNPAGPQVVGDDDDANAQPPEYTGPSVLSHSYTVNSGLIPEDLTYRESFTASGVYDSGLNAAATGPQGPIQSASAFGLNLSWGISGRRKIHRDTIGFTFTGNRAWYTQGDQFSGMNSRFGLDYSHYVSRRFTVRFTGSANILSQSYALQNPTPTPDTSTTDIADINVGATPTTQVFDNGSKSFSASANASWQMNSRLSFTAGGSYFVMMYNSPGLIGVGGEQAQGGANYRLSAKTTAGVFYSYSVYTFPDGQGVSNSQSLGGLYSYAFSRSTQLRLRAGGAIPTSRELEAVPLNPIAAQLFGLQSEIIEGRSKSLTEDLSGSLMKDFGGRATLSVSYSKGISPGNGLYLTSESETISVSASKKLFNRAVTLSMGRTSISAAGLGGGSYVTEFAHLGSAVPLNHTFGLSYGADYRHFAVETAPGLNNQVTLSVGFSWNHSSEALWPLW